MTAIELLKAREDVLAYEITILQPALFAGRIAHALPAFAALEESNSLTVAYCSRFGIDRGDTITQESLRRGDIQYVFLLARATTAAGREQDDDRGKAQTWEETWEFVGVKRHGICNFEMR